MPFLFQRKIGTKHEVISDTTVVNMLKRRCGELAEQHPGRQLHPVRRTYVLVGSNCVELFEEHTDLACLGAGESFEDGECIEQDGLDAFLERLRPPGRNMRRSSSPPRLDYAFHTAAMDPIREHLHAALAGLAPSATTIPLVSTVTGTEIDGTELDVGY
jgi:hypothetical protein